VTFAFFAKYAKRFIARAAFGTACLATLLPASAQAQSLSFIRDTEVERVVRSYMDPILAKAGLQKEAVSLYLVNDPAINAFVAEGQNMFLNTGLLMQLRTPNQVTGVIAHETGHISDGHLVRMQEGVRAATIPMLLTVAAGLAAMVAGAGDAGAAIMATGSQIGERQFMTFSRTQEASADQAALRYLAATEQSGLGMLEVFRRFEEDEILTDTRQDPFARSHPASSDRMANLRALVDASPYRDRKDSPEKIFAFEMVQAKLRGYIERPDITLRRYPTSNTSKPARYARAMAYFRQPDMEKAFKEINSLLDEEPNNPYFLEMLGQINVEVGRVAEGIAPYRRAVELLPDAPLIRVALAAAMLGTEDPKLTLEAQKQLETALKQENNNALGWYVLAQAHARLGAQPKADLATAERFFSINSYPQAMQFAYRAQRGLRQGTTDWQRASDIMAIAQSQLPERRRR